MNPEYHILFYKTVANYVERRQPYREFHLTYANAAADRGELILGGALDDPADGAGASVRVSDVAGKRQALRAAGLEVGAQAFDARGVLVECGDAGAGGCEAHGGRAAEPAGRARDEHGCALERSARHDQPGPRP